MPKETLKVNVDSETVELLREMNTNMRKMNSLDVKKELLRGILSGVGVVLGTTVVIGIGILILRQFLTVPVIGDFVNEIINVVEKK